MGDPDQDDDLATRQDLPELRRYDAGPPTIEERLSPFGSDSTESDPSMRAFPGTGIQAIPVTAARIHMRDLGAPDGVTLPDGMASPFALGSDGATSPDGHAALMPVTVVGPLSDAATVVGPPPTHPNAPTQPHGSGWGREVVAPSFAAPPTFVAPTYAAPSPSYPAPSPVMAAPPPSYQAPSPGFGAPPAAAPPYTSPPAAAPSFASPPPEVEVMRPSRPEVPAPNAPKVVVSPSMEMAALDVRAMAPAAAPPASGIQPPKVKRAPAAPTEVMLPALKRDKARKKESSDWPLIAGLVALVLVILGLVVGVVIGVMRGNDLTQQIPFMAPSATPAEPAPAEPAPTEPTPATEPATGADPASP